MSALREVVNRPEAIRMAAARLVLALNALYDYEAVVRGDSPEHSALRREVRMAFSALAPLVGVAA